MFRLRGQIRRGLRSREELIEAHLRMVLGQAKKLVGRGLDLADLVQEGNFGLIKAVEKYDGSYDSGFRAYAQLYIHQAMSRAISNTGRAIRVPVNVLADRERLDVAWDRFTFENQESPTLIEWSAYSKISTKRIFLAYSIPDEPLSLNIQVGEDEEEIGQLINLSDDFNMDDSVLAGQLKEALGKILDSLHPREAGVIKMRFGFSADFQYSLDEIGEYFGVTRERIRQIEMKTVSKLRHPMTSALLKRFLD